MKPVEVARLWKVVFFFCGGCNCTTEAPRAKFDLSSPGHEADVPPKATRRQRHASAGTSEKERASEERAGCCLA